MKDDKKNILVIKLGALGDFIQALGAMRAIREHHPNDRIILMTTKPFEALARESGYFDDILLDVRPRWHQIARWIKLRRFLNEGHFSRVYDLQNNDRTFFYFQLFKKPKPEWVGIAKGASHRNMSPERTAGNAFGGHIQTLSLAGIKDIKIDRLEWMKSKSANPSLPSPYVLLAPGSAPQHPQKRWPADRYAELAKKLAKKGYHIVVIGTKIEKEIAEKIKKSCPTAFDFTGETQLQDLASLARDAAGAIGNDTGPMHLIGPTGCPCLVLFSAYSNPAKHAPMGENVKTLQHNNLDSLSVEEVLENFKPR